MYDRICAKILLNYSKVQAWTGCALSPSGVCVSDPALFSAAKIRGVSKRRPHWDREKLSAEIAYRPLRETILDRKICLVYFKFKRSNF